MQLFFATLGFLTRLPIPKNTPILPQQEFAKGIIFYPIIGLLIGLIDYVIYCLLCYVMHMPVLGALGAVLAETMVTGGFHLDGLADTFDGFFSARKRERILEIMKDSRVGTNGALALLFTVLGKAAVYYSLWDNIGYLAVLLAPVAGKTMTPILMKSKYAREEGGIGSLYLVTHYTKYMVCAMGIGILLLVFFLREYSIVPLVVLFLGSFGFRNYCQKMIGGMTGDTLGAGYELATLYFLVTLAIEGGYVS